MFSAQGYDALRHGLACVRRSDRGVLRLAGADRATWLQGLVTNDVLSLQPGHRVYSAYLTPQGRMITDLWVVAATTRCCSTCRRRSRRRWPSGWTA